MPMPYRDSQAAYTASSLASHLGASRCSPKCFPMTRTDRSAVASSATFLVMTRSTTRDAVWRPVASTVVGTAWNLRSPGEGASSWKSESGDLVIVRESPFPPRIGTTCGMNSSCTDESRTHSSNWSNIACCVPLFSPPFGFPRFSRRRVRAGDPGRFGLFPDPLFGGPVSLLRTSRYVGGG